ncbi:hypothetical protein EDC04DRAFT_2908110 [Pisolithus marmoratus]|nr:hypothetical protein EDC04DRAFT_2908110 [Pisolithus marmoratus]
MDINYFDCNLDHLWLTWISVASLVALAAQHTVDLISSLMPPKASGPNASWNNQENSTYNSATQYISQFLTSGPPKTGAMVKKKWVSHIYQDIEGFRGKSGCHWDNVHGAGVQCKLDKEVFESYAKTHPFIHPFKNCGWEHYGLVFNIIPNSAAQGTNAFILHITQTASTSTTISQNTETTSTNRSTVPSGIKSPNVQSSQVIPPPPSLVLSSASALDASGDVPPTNTSNLRKQVHSEVAGDNDVGSAFPFVDASNISTFNCNKHAQLSAAVDSARSGHSHCSQKSTAPLDPHVQDLQTSIKQLMTSITMTLSLSVKQASITRSHAIQLLDGEDSNLPRSQRAFIWLSIAQSLGFTDIYLRTTDKEDQVEYVNLEYQLKFGSTASQAG